jgi:hypothetical protein
MAQKKNTKKSFAANLGYFLLMMSIIEEPKTAA